MSSELISLSLYLDNLQFSRARKEKLHTIVILGNIFLSWINQNSIFKDIIVQEWLFLKIEYPPNFEYTDFPQIFENTV